MAITAAAVSTASSFRPQNQEGVNSSLFPDEVTVILLSFVVADFTEEGSPVFDTNSKKYSSKRLELISQVFQARVEGLLENAFLAQEKDSKAIPTQVTHALYRQALAYRESLLPANVKPLVNPKTPLFRHFDLILTNRAKR
jgi:hypothetical protein